MAICKPEKELLPEITPASTLILDLQPLELGEKSLKYISHSICGILLQQSELSNPVVMPLLTHII